jgi:3-hydroxymyristoyl/3-hydroxydecanoyl-(acyl carrier protein) dehydratase
MRSLGGQVSGSAPLALGAAALRHLMPHRHPMTLLDCVEAVWLDERRVIAVKHVAHNDLLLAGHFRDFPVFPPALVIEAMAQASGLVMNVAYLIEERGVEPELLESPSAVALLPPAPISVLAESRVRLFRYAQPGETLRLHASLKLRRGPTSLFHVQATVGKAELARGEMVLAYPPYGPEPAPE